MTSSLTARAETLRELHHRDEPVVLPTVWDVWSAKTVLKAGFSALTVGSHPLADARGQSDGEGMSLTEALESTARITAAVEVPVSADLESGYDTAPAELVDRVLEAGIAGINIEDTVHSRGGMRSPEEHADYIAGLREHADRNGVPLVINARTDVFAASANFQDPLAEALHRLDLLEGVGADCLYPVKLPDTATLEAILRSVSTPVNVTAHPVKGALADGLSLQRLAQMGVSRISFGPLLQAALGAKVQEIVQPWSSH